MTHHTSPTVCLWAALAVASFGCTPQDGTPEASVGQSAAALTPPVKKAGPVAFAHQVVPTILGRRVTNGLELHALALTLEQKEEHELVDALFESPDYVEYWTQLLVDRLQVSRATAESRTAQPAICYQASGHDDATLVMYAEHIAKSSSQPFSALPISLNGLTFTPADVIRGAVLIDDLRVMQRAYLYPMLTYEVRYNGAGDPDRDASEALLGIYLGRDTGCLECHSSSFSTTDRWSGLDRHWPLDVDLEGSLFSRTINGMWHYGGQVGAPELQALDDVFDRGLFGANVPWGLDPICVKIEDRVGFQSVPTGLASLQTAPFGMHGAANIVDLEAQLTDGLMAMDDPALLSDRGAWSYATPDTTYSDCTTCHNPTVGPPSPNKAPSHDSLAPERSDGRILAALTRGFGTNMGPMATSFDDARSTLTALRNSHGTYDGDAPPVVLNGDQDLALAYGIAADLSADLLGILSGSPPVLEHGQPRTAAQRNLLESTTATLVESDWSLRAVLSEWVTSDHFNRPSPEATPPMLDLTFNPAFYPWVMDDEAPSRTNTVGDLVHRWPVPNLFISVARALRWPMPEMFGDGLTYPSQRSQQLMGRYTSGLDAGFTDITMLSLNAWEWAGWEQCNNCADLSQANPIEGDRPRWSTVGSVPAGWSLGDTKCCTYSGAKLDPQRAGTQAFEAVNGDLETHPQCEAADESQYTINSNVPYGIDTCWTDWIDLLTGQFGGTCADPTIAEALAIVRDRMLGDPTMLDGELAAALDGVSCNSASLTGIDCADALWSEGTLDDEPEKFLRRYAHTLTSTPDFMLAGLPTVVELPDAVGCYGCADGEPCTVDDYGVVIDGWLTAAQHSQLVSSMVAWWNLDLSASPMIEFEALNRGVQRLSAETMIYVNYGAPIQTWVVPPVHYGERAMASIPVDPGTRWFAFDANPELLADARLEDDRTLGIIARGVTLPTGYVTTYNALVASPPPFAKVDGPVIEMRMLDFDPNAWPSGQPLMGWVNGALGPQAPPGFATDFEAFDTQHVDLIFGPDVLGVRVAWSPPIAPPPPPPPD